MLGFQALDPRYQTLIWKRQFCVMLIFLNKNFIYKIWDAACGIGGWVTFLVNHLELGVNILESWSFKIGQFIFGIEWPARTYPCSHECFELNFRQIIAKTISLKVLVQITVYSYKQEYALGHDHMISCQLRITNLLLKRTWYYSLQVNTWTKNNERLFAHFKYTYSLFKHSIRIQMFFAYFIQRN